MLLVPAITRVALRALENMDGARIVLTAVPGGNKRVAQELGVSPGRVSQVLRSERLPRSWAVVLAELTGCSEWDIYQQLGQTPPVSPLGPLFDPVLAGRAPTNPAKSGSIESGFDEARAAGTPHVARGT